jgi:hypothetical protein
MEKFHGLILSASGNIVHRYKNCLPFRFLHNDRQLKQISQVHELDLGQTTHKNSSHKASKQGIYAHPVFTLLLQETCENIKAIKA